MTELARKIREGDARALARLATGIENRDPQALETLRELEPAAGHARIVGITGPPGAGKSTLVDALALELRKRGKTLAILAVDPSSRITGGAILGDRIRMQQHHADPGIFIRSMATRGTTGRPGARHGRPGAPDGCRGQGLRHHRNRRAWGRTKSKSRRLAQVTVVVLVPGHGRRCAGDQGRHHGDRRHLRDQQEPITPARSAWSWNCTPKASPAPSSARSRPKAKASRNWWTAIEARAQCAPIRAATVRERSSAACASTISESPSAVLDDAIAFYESLGLAVAHRETVATEKVDVAMLPVGDSRIELLEPTAPDSPIAKFLEKRGPGLHHVALRVPDLNAAVARLKASGARLLNEPRAGAGGHIYVFVHPASTGGVLLELIQESTTLKAEIGIIGGSGLYSHARI